MWGLAGVCRMIQGCRGSSDLFFEQGLTVDCVLIFFVGLSRVLTWAMAWLGIKLNYTILD